MSTIQNVRIKLAQDLGYSEYPNDKSADPYLDYIISESPGPRPDEEFLRLFSRIVTYFSGSLGTSSGTSSPSTSTSSIASTNARTLKACIDELCSSQELYFSDTKSDFETRSKHVRDSVFLILGLWTAMKSNFVSLRGQRRQIILSYYVKKGVPVDQSDQEPLEETLQGLIRGSSLIPSFSEDQSPLLSLQNLKARSDPNVYFPIDFIESLCIQSTALNASKLYSLAGVRIHWTNNISRHLLLSLHAGTYYLELFALPCILQGGCERTLEKTGIPRRYMTEVQESYANLFSPSTPSIVHQWLGKLIGIHWWCFCLSCCSRRLVNREIDYRKHGCEARGFQRANRIPFDSKLVKLMKENAVGWDQTSFPHLWSRIVTLETHLQNAKPWNFWVLFRDRREKLPFWTFL